MVDEFHRWQEATGADYFLLRLRHAHSGGPPHERIMEAIQIFGGGSDTPLPINRPSDNSRQENPPCPAFQPPAATPCPRNR